MNIGDANFGALISALGPRPYSMLLLISGVIMKDFISKEMHRILDDSSSGYEFPVEYFTGPVYSSPGYGSGFKSSIVRKDKEEIIPPYVIEPKKPKLEDKVYRDRVRLKSPTKNFK